MFALSQFHLIRPPFESSQEETFAWLIDAHCHAEEKKGMNREESLSFREKLMETLWRVGCKPGAIKKRGHVSSDFLHRNWDEMELFGKNLTDRSQCFTKHADLLFEAYYPDELASPDHLIHVTCTGYVSPSGAQKIVSKRNWGNQTTVTHAYHMGCYGAFPAIRMGSGWCENKRCDIVHTELCSLHFNPFLHRADQLVSQSLFADGSIKYSLSSNPIGPHLKVVAIQEEILPDSIDSMTWNVVDWGFQMSLSKALPVQITRALKGYLARLMEKARLSDDAPPLFAVHPGGPKILGYVQELLDLSDAQLLHSYRVLKDYGNMSSATVPHIWKAMLEDPAVEDKTNIISLAFGPGLSISGGILEKSCGP